MVAHVSALLRGLGAEVAVTEVVPGRPNLVATFPAARADAPTVAFVPHSDTVGVAGMTVPAFSATRHDGRIHGRGACDTKGPMAAALWALAQRRARADADAAKVRWVFAMTMGEEEMSTGAKALCESGFKADFAFALEPTELRAVRAGKGVLRLWVESRGRACHGSTPELGENAIYRLAPFVAACRDELAPAFAARRHPDLGGASLNLGVLQGGTELNIVPDRARAGLDIRTHPGLPSADALVQVRAHTDKLGLELHVHRDGPSYALPESHPWLRRIAPGVRGFETAPWFSDANVFNAHGIPSVAVGPGSIAQAHTRDEFITESALAEGAAAFERLIDHVEASFSS
jgi:Acetylornithine deacetylase/Succinyl-diaminopimelate desuccinylase and related deacylases